jgi:hypothetical protein
MAALSLELQPATMWSPRVLPSKMAILPLEPPKPNISFFTLYDRTRSPYVDCLIVYIVETHIQQLPLIHLMSSHLLATQWAILNLVNSPLSSRSKALFV